jgi:hypothetical protein
MPSESIIWTALPNGIHEDGNFLRVTVFVTPRLSADGGSLPLTAGTFPAFADWPAALADVKFAIDFDGAGAIGADPDPDATPPDSKTWHLLFDDCKVADGGFTDLSTRRFLSFPVRTTSAAVLGLYTQIAEASPTAFPPITTGPLAQLGRDLGQIGQHKGEFYPMLDGLIAEEQGPYDKTGRYLDRSSISASERERMAFVEAYRFYDRPGTRDPLGKTTTPPEPKPPELDFHAFAASCGDYPKLLRPLGLAIDLLVAFAGSIQPQGRIRVEVEAPAQFGAWMQAEEARPWTRYELADRRFLGESRLKEGDLVDGTLALDNADYFVVNQLDVDGSALKTVDFAGNLLRLAEHLNLHERSMTDDESSLPALRTGGFTVARDNRAERIVGVIDAGVDHDAAQSSGGPAELFAEDINRGYRLDVEDLHSPGDWRSLHRRKGKYVVRPLAGAPAPLTVEPDEGYVKGASASSVPEDEDDLYVHETLFGWDGWSLAAKRPGSAITNDGSEDIEPKNPTDFPLFTEFEATPGTLPRLRFGREYRFRARAVDLAGNSVREDDLVPEHVTEPHTFRRFEPVPAPAVVPRRPFTEGESLLRMVIRSTLGVLPKDYVELARITGVAGHTDPLLAYLEANERHLAPPLASQQLAEWHGKFDAAFGESTPQTDLDKQFDVSALESGSFLDPGPNVSVFNPDPAATPTDLTDPARKKGDPLEPGEYVLHDTDDLVLPYLPDPLALGASLTTLPGDATTRLQRWEQGGSWHVRKPLRIRIENGSGAPSYSASKRLLTVFLPQAEIVTVRLSSFLEPADLEVMAVWMLESAAARAAQQQDAERGLHWMLTPSEPLTLVHAVEKPLQPPVIDVPPADGAKRKVGETFAALTGAINNHAKSTGRIDIEAEWTEPIDDLAQDAPSTLSGQAHVADFELEATEDDCAIGLDDAPATAGTPRKHRVRHEFGDTKHRRVTYHALATTRFREYFPREITDEPTLITHAGPQLELNVRSSRRPDPPEVLYVVPTWTWHGRTVRGLTTGARSRRAPSTFVRTRTGGGLRVYLDRPWYSSGAGELLGVVLEDQPWVTWPIDLGAGLTVSATARALADELAEKVIAEGLIRARGARSAPASERLVAGVQAVQPRAASTARAGGSAEVHAAALTSHMAAETTPSGDGGDGGVALFTDAQLALLESALAKFVPVSGDPQKYVTHWGLDPIWGSAPVHAGPYIHQFPLRVAVGTDISLLEAPGHVVTVVGHEPRFDDVRKLWYCDLQLNAGPSYYPLVRLALARYQPDSIAGEHLSRVVFPDFTQLVAERRASLTRLGRSGVAVSLRGPAGYTENATDVGLLFAGDQRLLNLSRFAVAQVERRRTGATTDLAWTPVGEEVRLDLSVVGGLADIRYSATVPLPARDPAYELRLALREYEIFETDDSERDDYFVRPSSFPFSFLRRPIKYRLVYADDLAL